MPKIPVTEYVLPFGKAETRFFDIPQIVKDKWERLENDDHVIDYEILSDGTLSVEVWASEDDEYEHVTAAHILDFAVNHTEETITNNIIRAITDAYMYEYEDFSQKENVGRRKNEER